MKKLLALTTSLCAAFLAAVNFGGAAAFAEQTESGLDSYPQKFLTEVTFENLEDYEIAEDKILFLDNGAAYEYGNERLIRLETVPEFDGYAAKDKFSLGNFYYSFSAENVLTAYNELTTQTVPLGNFSVLKKYGEKAYAIKENALYELNETTYEKVPLSYLDYSSTKTVKTGVAAQTVKEFSLQSPVFVTLKNGAFMTEIDIEKLDGNYFAAGETYKAGTDISAQTALLLATAGANDSISIVMVCGTEGGKSKCYIMHSENATVTARAAVTDKELGATVTVDGAYIYSAPYVCKSTQLKDVKSGDPVKVVGEVKKADNPELALDFYKVEFTAESGVQTGYVPFGYVSPFTYIENDPSTTPDPDYSEENLVKEVVLVIVVIVLVLTAGGYIVYVLTSNKTKKNNKEK